LYEIVKLCGPWASAQIAPNTMNAGITEIYQKAGIRLDITAKTPL